MILLTLLLSGLASAASPDQVRPSLESMAEMPADRWSQARDAARSSVDAEALDALSSDASWRVGLTAQAIRVWQASPERASATWTSRPALRRDGALVFRGEGEPAVIGERLQHGAESVATRRALVDWLRRSTTAWPDWADSAFADEAEAEVRAAWIDAARYLRGTSRASPGGRQVVADGFTDADPRVRSASARIAAYLDAPELVSALKGATADPSDEVAGLAARSLGMLRAGDAYAAVAAVLDRADPRVRLWTVRALQRLDAERAKSDAAIVALKQDPDPRVARAAADVTAR